MTRNLRSIWLRSVCLVTLLASLVHADGAVAESAGTVRAEGAAGTLRTIGNYPANAIRRGETVTQFADGSVFVYGGDSDGTFDDGEVSLDPVKRLKGKPYLGQEAVSWEPNLRGWVRRGRPPTCSFNQSFHTATRLGDNRILVAGGLCDEPVRMTGSVAAPRSFNQLSLWNQTTQAWESAPSLAQGRLNHTATILADDSVMIIGGHADRQRKGSVLPVLGSVELFRDSKDRPPEVTALPELMTPRAKHTSIRLSDGRVLVVGGVDADNRALASTEIFDPATKAWSAASSLEAARYSATTELLDDGRVLVIGGSNTAGQPMASVEIYTPATNSWAAAPRMLIPLKTLSSTKLASGDVLVAGTSSDNFGHTASFTMLWRSTDSQWQPAGALRPDGLGDIRNREDYRLVTLAGGGALIFGDRAVLQWLPAKAHRSAYHPSSGRVAHATVELADGRFLLAGGRIANDATTLAEIYDPTSNAFSLVSPMSQARYTGMPFRASLASVVLDDGRVVIAGGWVRSADDPRQTVAHSPDVFDPATGQWSIVTGVRFEPYEHVHFNQLDDGRVLFFASYEQEDQAPFAFRALTWDPRSDRVVEHPVGAKPRSGASVTVLRDGRVLILGGSSYDTDLAELWNSHSGEVSELSFPRSLREGKVHSLQLRDGDVLLVNAGSNAPYSAPDNGAVWVWNAQTKSFAERPRLDSRIDWPLIERRDGSLVAWQGNGLRRAAPRRLEHGANAWETLPYVSQTDAVVRESASGKLLALSSSPPHVATWNTESVRWESNQDGFFPMEHPAIVDLEGSLAVVGDVYGSGVGIQTWSPSTGAWRMDPNIRPDRASLGRATRLKSGAILILSRGAKSPLLCDIYLPKNRAWSDCGVIPHESGEDLDHLALGRLEDGRVALIAGPDNAKVFDEVAGQWTTLKAEWNLKELSHGEAVRSSKPLLRVFDTHASQWIEANELGGKHYSGFSGRPSMLWDRGKQRWTYITASGMGRNGFLLPDGCAIAGFPLSLYNPTTGAMTALDNVVIGFWPRAMTVLSDGTVVAVGIPDVANDAGIGHFRRRVSCAGFDDPNTDFVSMPGTFADPAAATVRTSTSSAPAAERNPPAKQTPLSTRIFGWVLLILVSSLVLHPLLKAVIQHLTARLSRDTLVQSINWITALRTKFSGVRILRYGAVLVIAASVLASYLIATRRESPNPSCYFPGRWTSTAEPGATVTLQGDGKYVYESRRFGKIRGHWEANGDTIIWRMNGTEDLDINKILQQTKTAFTLEEQDGKHTNFQLIGRLPQQAACYGESTSALPL